MCATPLWFKYALASIMFASVVSPMPAASAGDFNGDGFDDLAIGSPNEKIDAKSKAGRVYVIYGSATGPKAGVGAVIPVAVIEEQAPWFPAEVPDAGAEFGWSLAEGDFNDDGYDDLAIAAPGRTMGGVIGAGAVRIVYGGRSGLGAGTTTVSAATLDRLPTLHEQFGFALVTGHFNTDGAADLAVGIPFADDGRIANNGAVAVFLGIDDRFGLAVAGRSLLTQAGWGAVPVAGDRFGWALASGDFDHDGADDLSIGTPNRDFGFANPGLVYVTPGGPDATRFGVHSTVSQEMFPGGEVSEPGDRFGWSLASGDFDDNGVDDLAIGAPYEDFGAGMDAGAVFITGGSAGVGLTFAWRPDQVFEQEYFGLDVSETNDRYSAGLTVGDFDGDGIEDLAVGAPGQVVDGIDSAGMVHVIPGALLGPGWGAPPTKWTQGAPVLDSPEDHDELGWTLGSGDFDGDHFDDLTISALLEDVGIATRGIDAGLVHVLFGAAGGVSGVGDQVWHKDRPGVPNACRKDESFGSLPAR